MFSVANPTRNERRTHLPIVPKQVHAPAGDENVAHGAGEVRPRVGEVLVREVEHDDPTYIFARSIAVRRRCCCCGNVTDRRGGRVRGGREGGRDHDEVGAVGVDEGFGAWSKGAKR